MRELLQHWTETSIILTSEESVWRNKRPRSRTVFFEEDRSLTWSTNTSGSLVPMILSRIMQTYWQLLFEMMIFRNSIQNGTIFVDDTNPIWWHLGKIVYTNKEYESLRSSRPYWNCTIWRFIRRSSDLIITDWKLWWREVSSKKFEIRILGTEIKIFEKKRRGQESGNKTACVGNGKLTGSVVKETIVVSDTIRISEQNRQSRTLLQDLLRSTVWKMNR